MADFAWNGDDADSVVLGWQPRTAVYRTRDGVVIRQESDGMCDDHGDDQILLTAMGALAVAWKMIETAHEVGLPQPCRKLMRSLDAGPVEPPPGLSETVSREHPQSEEGPLLRVMNGEAAE